MADNNIKIAKLETQMGNVENKIDDLKVQVHEISLKLDNLSMTQAKVKELEADLKEFKAEVKVRNFRKGWIYPTLSAVAGSIITYLLIHFLNSTKG